MKITVNEPVKPSRIFSDVKVGQVCEFTVDGTQVIKVNEDTGFNLVAKREVVLTPHLSVTSIFNLEEITLSKV